MTALHEATRRLMWDDGVGPWPGLALAASDAIHHLNRLRPMDLWMVTHVEGDRQVVVASAGPWSAQVPTGTSFSWAQTFCVRMAETGAAALEPDIAGSERYGPMAVGVNAVVRAYVGVPVVSSEGRLFGSLCAFSGTVQDESLLELAEPTRMLGRLLSTIAAGEQTAADRSQEAAGAYALAERDRLTALLNRRGWDSLLAAEEQRAKRYGSPVSLLALDLDDLKLVNDTGGHAAGDAALAVCAGTLRESCRPGDSAARTGGDEFGILAVECDAASARALEHRVRAALRAAGVACSVGVATRRPGEGLSETWGRADAAMYRDKHRRRSVRR